MLKHFLLNTVLRQYPEKPSTISRFYFSWLCKNAPALSNWGGFLWTALIKAFHRFTIVFRSRPFQNIDLFLDYQNIDLILFDLDFSWVQGGEVFHLQLSNGDVQILYPNRFGAMIPAIFIRASFPAENEQPHYMMLPPSCFTIGCGGLGVMSSLIFAPTISFRIMLKKFYIGQIRH